MAEYYFDIETPGPEKGGEPALSVAWQRLKRNRAAGEINILKSWEMGGRKKVLKEVLRLGVFDWAKDPWEFIPVGMNLMFDFHVLIGQMEEAKVKQWTKDDVWAFLRNKPFKDIKPVLVLMNDGRFQDAGLHNFAAKKPESSDEVIARWRAGDYKGVDEYIRGEAEGFVELYDRVARHLAQLGFQIRSEVEAQRHPGR